jgi:membrane fusion protein, multidrug efflux system
MFLSSSSVKKAGLFVLVVVIVVLGAGFVFFSKKNDAGAVPVHQQPVRPVKIMTLSGSTPSELRTFTGVIQARHEVDLAFRVGGPLVELDPRIGQYIQKGDVIARIDSRDFEINRMRLSAALTEANAGLAAMKAGARDEDVASLKAQLKAAQVAMRDAETNYRRQKRLLEHKATTQAAYDNARAAFDTARANVDVARQGLKKARSGARIEDIEAAEAGIKRLQADLRAADNALEDTRLIAPFDGYIGQKQVENFENVDPGEAIVTLLDFSRVEVHSAISEDVIVRQNEIIGVTCTLDAYAGKTFQATIRELGHKTDQANQSYPLTVSLATDEKLIARPGMAASLTIELNKAANRNDGFSIPSSAVFADPTGQPCVWRVDRKTLRVIKTPVTTGSLHQDTIQITSGLSAGDQVVIAGARFLQDSQKVRILNRTKGGA